MAHDDTAAIPQVVKGQYERFPYPSRDPADERRRVIGTWLDNLDLVNHHCFRGAMPFRRGFRVLVAGGGTGDGTIYLALQLRETDAEIVHLDVSAASTAIARARAEVHGLTNIRWVEASLLDLPRLDLGRFHYINCSGVLHHLVDPDAGLRALLAVLAEGGALGLFVYGQYGRTGVYQLQEMLRLINRDVSDDAVRVRHARSALACLPKTNWFRRGEELHSDHTVGGDAGIYDLLLHASDRAYTVPELYAWLVDQHGLSLQFSDTHRGRLPYDVGPLLHDADPALRAAIEALPLRERQAIAELWGGFLTKHLLYATRDADTVAAYGDPDLVPLFPWETQRPTGDDFVRLIAGHGGKPFLLQHRESGLSTPVDPGRHVASIFAALDGRRSFRAIFERVRADPAHRGAPPADAVLFDEFRPWFDALESIERLVLTRDAYDFARNL